VSLIDIGRCREGLSIEWLEAQTPSVPSRNTINLGFLLEDSFFTRLSAQALTDFLKLAKVEI